MAHSQKYLMAAPEQSSPWGRWWWRAGRPSAGPSASGPGPSRSSCWQWSCWVHCGGAALWRVQPGSMMCVASRVGKGCATWLSTREEMHSDTWWGTSLGGPGLLRARLHSYWDSWHPTCLTRGLYLLHTECKYFRNGHQLYFSDHCEHDFWWQGWQLAFNIQ